MMAGPSTLRSMRTRYWPPRGRCALAGLAALAMVTSLLSPLTAEAEPMPANEVRPAGTAIDRVADPDGKLGNRWRSSADEAVVAVPSPAGLQILAAREREAYRWRTVATLADPLQQTDLWIGQACVTGDGKSVVAVFAPRHFANRPVTFDSGGYAAIVNLASGSVRRLAQRVSIAYFNPGCGTGGTAVLTTDEGESHDRTVLHIVDTTNGNVNSVSVAGQITSAVPDRQDIVAAHGHQLIRIDRHGRRQTLSTVDAVPHDIRVDNKQGLGFVTTKDATSTAWRATGNRVTRIAQGRLDLLSNASGELYLVGDRGSAPLPDTWHGIADPRTKAVSSHGHLAVRNANASTRPEPEVDVAIEADALSTGQRLDFAVPIEPGPGPAAEGAAQSMATTSVAGEDTPIDLNATCAIPRNDPYQQTYQPTPQQIEWATDLAVQGRLTASRPANYRGWNLPSYSPQALFPPISLNGGGRIPAQILLGVLAQESNLWQASWHVLEGLSGNALVGDFYGTGDAITTPDFSKADCGYGIGQVTDGMRASSTYWTPNQKKAIALDYQANIAASLQILALKWNEARAGGLLINNGDPSRIVNWWFAIWAYNSGYHPKNPNNPDEPWGVGWSNNPINPKYKPSRPMFLKETYDDARTPNLWSYPERVMGWASYPIIKNGQRAYAPARYATEPDVVQPVLSAFCRPTAVAAGGNQCDPSGATYPNDLNDPPGPCMRRDLMCWWHTTKQTVTDGDCSAQDYCGVEVLRYGAGDTEPAATNPHPSVCSVSGLGTGQVTIIDDVEDSTRRSAAGLCQDGWSNGGRFSLNFAGTYDSSDRFMGFASKVDFHQVGSGFGGHFWFAHSYCVQLTRTCKKVPAPNMRVTGTWTPNALTPGWHRVLVHIPSHGAHTQQATYKIYLGDGRVKTRVIEQRRMQNEWVSLGTVEFVNGSDTPRVELSNIDGVGDGTEDVAFDALAFVRLPAKPRQFVVALGDSYASGEGNRVFERYSDNNTGNDYRNACRRSTNAWARQVGIPGSPASNYTLETQRDPNMDFQFKACSGARTYNVVPFGVSTATGEQEERESGQPNRMGPQFHWVTQIDAGFLDENTTLVTIAIGGNDARWTAILGKCVFSTTCMENGDKFPVYPSFWDTETAASTYMRNYMSPAITTTLQHIRAKAPNATIILMGYPRPFNGEKRYPCATGLTVDQMAMADRLADTLATTMSDTVAATHDPRIYFADPRERFRENGACTEQEYINGLILGPQSEGDNQGPLDLSMNSFHPNEFGQIAYTDVLFNKLYEIGYRW
jgi:hypothetical protein